MDHHGQPQPHGIHYEVALATLDFLAGVIASGPPFSVVFTVWLSIMAALGVGWRPSAARTTGRRVYPFPGAIPRPTAEVFVQGLPRGQIVRHQAPGTAAPQHIQDALHHLPQVHGAGAAARFGRRQQGCPPCPLGIAEVAGVSFSSHVYAGVWGWGLTYTIVQNQHFGNTLLVLCCR